MFCCIFGWFFWPQVQKRPYVQKRPQVQKNPKNRKMVQTRIFLDFMDLWWGYMEKSYKMQKRHNSMFECCSAKYESYQTDCFDTSYKSTLRVWLFSRKSLVVFKILDLAMLLFYWVALRRFCMIKGHSVRAYLDTI